MDTIAQTMILVEDPFQFYSTCMATITLSQARVTEQKDVVVLPVAEYRRLLAASVPTHYLTGKAALRLGKLVDEGLREYREGKTRQIKSLADLD